MLSAMPNDNPSRVELVKAFQDQMNIKYKPIVTPLPGVPFTRLTDFGAGVSAHRVFDAGMWIYSACYGMKQGWLNKETYIPEVWKSWRSIVKYFKPELPEPNSPFNILFRPHLTWSGIMFAATGMKSLEDVWAYKKEKPVSQDLIAGLSKD
jgi:hypothetical protein